MKVLVTAGPTQEYIDDVRIITNISTGRTGITIAREFGRHVFAADIDEIIVLIGKGVDPRAFGNGLQKVINIRYIPFVTAVNLETIMEEYVPQVDIVIHAAAVSDFTFGNAGDSSIKLKSNSKEDFIKMNNMHKAYLLNDKGFETICNNDLEIAKNIVEFALYRVKERNEL